MIVNFGRTLKCYESIKESKTIAGYVIIWTPKYFKGLSSSDAVKKACGEKGSAIG
jgi:hypothetical protein